MVSRKVKAVLAIVLLAVAVFAVFAAWTYPETVVRFSVSFTVGTSVRTEGFQAPFLHGLAQVRVTVETGSALWSARIWSGDQTIWSHTAAQGGQTTYTSDWIPLASGHYNATLRMIGIGSLEAEMTVTTKGGFW